MRYLSLFFVLGLLSGCQPSQLETTLRATLDKQAEAWNRGDLEGFMAPYWHSDELVFVAPMKKQSAVSGELVEVRKTTRGWRQTLERYRTTYPTKERMGHLTFTVQQIQPGDVEEATLQGRYKLENDTGTSSGSFVLTWARIEGEWVIVRDETTADP